MAKRKSQPDLRPTVSIWKKDAKLWYVEKEDLLKAIAESKNSEPEMRRIMGYGYN